RRQHPFGPEAPGGQGRRDGGHARTSCGGRQGPLSRSDRRRQALATAGATAYLNRGLTPPPPNRGHRTMLPLNRRQLLRSAAAGAATLALAPSHLLAADGDVGFTV